MKLPMNPASSPHSITSKLNIQVVYSKLIHIKNLIQIKFSSIGGLAISNCKNSFGLLTDENGIQNLSLTTPLEELEEKAYQNTITCRLYRLLSHI